MTDIAYIFLISIYVYMLGRFVLDLWGFRFAGILEASVFSIAIGLGILSFSVMFIGLAGILYTPVVFAAVLLSSLPLLWHFRRGFAAAFAVFKKVDFRPRFEGATLFVFACGAALLVAATASLLGTLAPPVVADSLCYHLQVPKRFIWLHRIDFLPFTANSLFPLFMEMLYVFGLLLKGAAFAKLFHYLFAVVGCAAVMSFAKEIFRVRWPLAFLAGAVFFLTPGINNQITTAYVDVAMSALLFLSFYSFLRWRDVREIRWAALCGVLAGFAMSVKFVSVLFVAILAAMYAVSVFEGRGSRREGILSFLIFICFAALCGLGWYLRAFAHTGNPLYPYFADIFGSGHNIGRLGLGGTGVPKSLINLFLSPWLITFRPDRFGGIGNQLGPIFLLFLPLAFLRRQKSTPVKFALCFAALYFLGWFFSRQNLRFLFPLAPVLSALIVYGFEPFLSGKKFFSFAFKGIMLFLLITLAGLSVYHARHYWRVSLGIESEPNYLRRFVPSYMMSEYINKNLPRDAKILSEENELFYFEREATRESIYREITQYGKRSEDPEKTIKYLLDNDYSHILYREPLRNNVFKKDPAPLDQLKGPDPGLYLTRKYNYTYKKGTPEEETFELYEIRNM